MGPVHRLLLGLRVPPRVQEEDVVRLSQGQSESSGLEGDEEDVSLPVTELGDDPLTVTRPTV